MGLRVLIRKDETGGKEASFKCLCRNAFSFGNKQEKLELPGQMQSCNIAAGTEMWWDRWHDWSAPMDSSLGKKRTEDCHLCERVDQVKHAFLWTEQEPS